MLSVLCMCVAGSVYIHHYSNPFVENDPHICCCSIHNIWFLAVFSLLRLYNITHSRATGYRLACLVINIHVALWNIFYRCVADSFIPAPTLEMTFDGRSMVIQQDVSEHLETSSNHPDYKYRVFRAVAVTEGPLEMQVEDNRLPLKCTATVRDPGSVVETMIRPVLESKISGWNWGMLRPM